MDEQQVLLDTFVARIRHSAALCRGDKVQMENYADTVVRLPAGESGHLTAAATGESLAISVLTQVADYCEGAVPVVASFGILGNPTRDLTSSIGQILERELPPTLGDVPLPIVKMICDEILVIALDVLRGKESEADKLYESIQKEQRASRIHRTLDRNAPWIGNLLGSIMKSFTR